MPPIAAHFLVYPTTTDRWLADKAKYGIHSSKRRTRVSESLPRQTLQQIAQHSATCHPLAKH
jgi:hypothetical protein